MRIDVHVHLAAFPEEGNGCYASRSFQKGILFNLVKWNLGLKGKSNREINLSYLQKLSNDLRDSREVDRAVLLSLDGVYGESGELDFNKTHFMVSNDCLFNAVSRYPDLFYAGPSVNPQRKDALDELHRVIEKGAKLVKVLPNSQNFDPMNSRYKKFYRILADKKIPLLSHIGYEFSVKAGCQAYGFPERLKNVLDEGVTVIGAHACSSAVFFNGTFFKQLLDLTEKYPHFFVDLSAVTLPNRAHVLYQLKRHPELSPRFLFGSDYPLSAYATPFLGSLPAKEQIRLWKMKNTFDKQSQILKSMGIKINPDLTRQLLKIK